VILTSFADPKATIVSQPMTIRFEGTTVFGAGTTPDFSIRWSDGRFELVEVKYRVDLRANWSWLWPGLFDRAGCGAREWRSLRHRDRSTASACRGLENAKRLIR